MNLLKPNGVRSKLAIQLIIGVMIMDLVSLYSDSLEYQLLISDFIDIDIATANDTRQQIIGILYLAIYLASVVFFILWFRRAYYNLHQRADVLNYSENWATIAWFIPFISLFRPYQITKEIFEETENYLKVNKSNYNESTSIKYVRIWWAFWIFSNIIGNICFKLSLKAETIEEFQNVSILNIVNGFIGIPTGIFTILMIKEYSKIETLFYETEKKETSLEQVTTYEDLEEKKADL